MKWILLLPIVVIIKIVLEKGLMLGLILLTVYIKGISIKKNPDKWDKYFLSLKEDFLNKYVIVLYASSNVLSSYITYVIFNVFGFQNSLFNTILLFLASLINFGIKYRKKGKQTIQDGLNKVQNSILKENEK